MSERLLNTQTRPVPVAPGVTLRVEAIADLICPFCFIGKRHLQTALQAVQGPVEVNWFPWQLNPDMPEAGLSFTDYLVGRFGNLALVEPVLEGLVRDGKQAGVDFRFDRIARVPNTLKAHQVLYLAELEGQDQSGLAEEFMSAYLERGEDIGDPDVLCKLAERHGLVSDDVKRIIDDEKARDVVVSRESKARASGISGVPGFLLNRRLLIVGAQSPDAMVNAFDRAMFGEGVDDFASPALH